VWPRWINGKSSQRFCDFNPLDCMRLVAWSQSSFVLARLSRGSRTILCCIVLAGGPDNFLLLLVLIDVDDDSFWRSLLCCTPRALRCMCQFPVSGGRYLLRSLYM
jgi:hypothetical protein